MKLSKLFLMLPFLIVVTLIDTLICCFCAQSLLFSLIKSGIDKHVALGLSLLMAVILYSYLRFNHKIRDYLRQGDSNEQ